jgi:hypothetical protein
VDFGVERSCRIYNSSYRIYNRVTKFTKLVSEFTKLSPAGDLLLRGRRILINFEAEYNNLISLTTQGEIVEEEEEDSNSNI